MISIDLQKTLHASDGVLDLRVALTLEKGTFVTLYGPSGAGKTSTLRMLSGLMRPDQGRIVAGDAVWYDSGRRISLPPQKRNIGFVFQDYALFPNMTVLQNLHFAIPKNKKKAGIDTIMQILALEDLANRKPANLSGGQQQRVALARAIVQEPELLLLDEPLAALDLEMRLNLQDYLLTVHGELGLTTIMVSHDIGEIVKLSNRVLELERGRICKDGTPEEVFFRNKLSGKFRFIGEVMRIEPQEVIYVVTVRVHSSVVKIIADASDIKDLKPGDRVVMASKAFNPVLYKIT
jgi:molybdate transport system ATP-binding protein